MRKTLLTILFGATCVIFGFLTLLAQNWIQVSTGTVSAVAGYTTIQVNGSPLTQRAILNWINGTNNTASCSDNAGNASTDCTFNGSGGGGGATISGLYANYSSTDWSPLYQSTKPATTGSWTAGGSTSTLADITGGGLSFLSPAAQSPGGWTVATAGSTWTFTAFMPGSQAGTGALGLFCADNAGNASLYHKDNASLSVSHWTGMQNGGTPAFAGAVANNWNPQNWSGWMRMVVDSTNRSVWYSANGINWFEFVGGRETKTSFVTCTKVGFEGYGDTVQGSISTILSVTNTTP